MLRALTFAAWAAYLTIPLAEGGGGADLLGQEVPSKSTFPHGVGNEQLQQYLQGKQPKKASLAILPALGVGIFAALSMGLSLVLKSILRFISRKVGGNVPSGSWHSSGGAEEINEEAAEGVSSPGWSSAEVDPGATSTTIESVPAYNPSVLGSEEVQSRIDEMELLLQRIKEAEDSDNNLDSTGMTFERLLQQANYYRQHNENADFEPSVPEEQILKFRELLQYLIDAIMLHYGPDRCVYIFRDQLMWNAEL
ncbi:hypothetical protein EAH_00022300 [Eimeria acervulina]|uniref:Uncharacterized protein n=1 Tax=Eimeria acervulina TaxID=5801 RepID=U6GAL3_EIMAC|nr:hypothetical protein EAH_00022300 [Eimeria acervulina]CDI77170.1 hypothetical protein EAH_00022300 [Eimeria acervulina]